MMNRRIFCKNTLALSTGGFTTSNVFANPTLAKKMIFVHGRAQEGKDPDELKELWIKTLNQGLALSGLSLDNDVDVRFPFYGDLLIELVNQFDLPLSDDIKIRGEDSIDKDFLKFQAAVLDDLRKKSGISDDQVGEEYEDDVLERGPQNWRWVRAIAKALDKNAGGLTSAAMETFLRDVYIYNKSSAVSQQINEIILSEMDDEPAVIVGHSLGSVVAYNCMHQFPGSLSVPLYLTIGSPLAIRNIRDQLSPIERPGGVSQWLNAYDNKDIVSLYPLDTENFPVEPPIINYSEVQNQTDNRHGIVGYLNNAFVSARIAAHLG